MRHDITYICRHLVYRLTLQCTKREMGVPAFIQNILNTFNSLSRLKKIILVATVVLVLLYYVGPFIFRTKRSNSIQVEPMKECLTQNLVEFQSRLDGLDAFASGDFDEAPPSRKMAYVGNGNVAASLGTNGSMYVRLYRALSQPVKYWPVIQAHLTGRVKESSVLDVKSGLAHKIQVKETVMGCISISTQLYAHRARPALLVQYVNIQNPSQSPITVQLEQIGASGWDDVATEEASYKQQSGGTVHYKVYFGTVPVTGSDSRIALAVAAVKVASNSVRVEASSSSKLHFLTAVYYTKPFPAHEAPKYVPDCIEQAKGELQKGLNINENILKQEHIRAWGKLWFSGFSISTSLAAGALNGDHINKTLYYVLSNSPAPLHNVISSPKDKLEIEKVLYFPDRCYEGHSTLVSGTLWIDPESEPQVARVVTTWMITLEKQGCIHMVQAGAEGILQAMILSLGPLHFHKQHLEMTSHPRDLHRDLHFRRINYGNNTHVNISVVVGEDNKATLFVALDRNDKPYYGCDAGCLDPPIQLSNERHQFPVKLTDPVTSVLYITADKQHMEELKHAIHVKEIIEAPAHEHHVIALHKHGHHFGGLPTIFWVSIAFLIIIFHLFLFKLIYNEYCQAYLRRTWKEMNIFKKKIQDPSREKLLPDPLKYPYIQPPYTLVIELTGVLIHPDWTYSTGWRFKKRPGIDYFLQQVGPPLYEVVIYSSESGMTADPLVNHLDPQGYVMYRLYRDATRYMNGHHVKDLSCLNRDMSRIIMLDCNPDSVKLQPQNSLVLKKWTGEDNDRTLIDLAHFLKTIAASGVDDIRAVLEYYSQFDDPLSAFKDNQRRLQEEEEARAKLVKEESKKKSWLSGFTNRR